MSPDRCSCIVKSKTVGKLDKQKQIIVGFTYNGQSAKMDELLEFANSFGVNL